jgi:hypothetical protein
MIRPFADPLSLYPELQPQAVSPQAVQPPQLIPFPEFARQWLTTNGYGSPESIKNFVEGPELDKLFQSYVRDIGSGTLAQALGTTQADVANRAMSEWYSFGRTNAANTLLSMFPTPVVTEEDQITKTNEEYGLGSQLKNVLRSAGQATVSTVGGIVGLASPRAGAAVEEFGEQLFDYNDPNIKAARDDAWRRSIEAFDNGRYGEAVNILADNPITRSELIGQGLSFVVPGAILKVIGRVKALGSVGQAVSNRAGTITAGIEGTSIPGLAGNEAYERAIEAGATPEQANQIARSAQTDPLTLAAAGAGFVPIAETVMNAKRAAMSGNALARGLKTAAVKAPLEAAQEAFEEYGEASGAQNALMAAGPQFQEQAQEIRPGFNALVGGLAGGMAGGIAGGVQGVMTPQAMPSEPPSASAQSGVAPSAVEPPQSPESPPQNPLMSGSVASQESITTPSAAPESVAAPASEPVSEPASEPETTQPAQVRSIDQLVDTLTDNRFQLQYGTGTTNPLANTQVRDSLRADIQQRVTNILAGLNEMNTYLDSLRLREKGLVGAAVSAEAVLLRAFNSRPNTVNLNIVENLARNEMTGRIANAARELTKNPEIITPEDVVYTGIALGVPQNRVSNTQRGLATQLSNIVATYDAAIANTNQVRQDVLRRRPDVSPPSTASAPAAPTPSAASTPPPASAPAASVPLVAEAASTPSAAPSASTPSAASAPAAPTPPTDASVQITPELINDFVQIGFKNIPKPTDLTADGVSEWVKSAVDILDITKKAAKSRFPAKMRAAFLASPKFFRDLKEQVIISIAERNGVGATELQAALDTHLPSMEGENRSRPIELSQRFEVTSGLRTVRVQQLWSAIADWVGVKNPELLSSRFRIVDTEADLPFEYGTSELQFSQKVARFKAENEYASWITLADQGKWVEFANAKTLEDINELARQDFENVRIKGSPLRRIAGRDEVVVEQARARQQEVIDANYNYLKNAYSTEPVLQSLLLRMSIAGLDSNTFELPPRLIPAATAEVALNFKNNRVATPKKALKLYAEIAQNFAEEIAETTIVGLEGGRWIELPQVLNTDSQEERNKKFAIWRNLSFAKGTRQDWCTSRGVEETYALLGPMFVFRKDNESLLAVRFQGDEIVEIQSQRNDGTIPPEYAEEIQNFTKNYTLSESASITLYLALHSTGKYDYLDPNSVPKEIRRGVAGQRNVILTPEQVERVLNPEIEPDSRVHLAVVRRQDITLTPKQIEHALDPKSRYSSAVRTAVIQRQDVILTPEQIKRALDPEREPNGLVRIEVIRRKNVTLTPEQIERALDPEREPSQYVREAVVKREDITLTPEQIERALDPEREPNENVRLAVAEREDITLTPEQIERALDSKREPSHRVAFIVSKRYKNGVYQRTQQSLDLRSFGVKGVFDSSTGNIYVVASNLDSIEDGIAVYAHEVAHRSLARYLNSDAKYNELKAQVKSWANAKFDSPEYKVFQIANKRAKASGFYESEILPYAIEEAVKLNLSKKSNTLSKFIEAVRTLFTNIWRSVLGKPPYLTTNNLVTIAQAVARYDIYNAASKGAAAEGIQFSLTDKEESPVDEILKEIGNPEPANEFSREKVSGLRRFWEKVAAEFLPARKVDEIMAKAGIQTRFENSFGDFKAKTASTISIQSEKVLRPLEEAIEKLLAKTNSKSNAKFMDELGAMLWALHGVERNYDLALRRTRLTDEGQEIREALVEAYEKDGSMSRDEFRTSLEAVVDRFALNENWRKEERSGADTDTLNEVLNRLLDKTGLTRQDLQTLQPVLKAVANQIRDNIFASNITPEQRRRFESYNFDWWVPLRGKINQTQSSVIEDPESDELLPTTGNVVAMEGRHSPPENPLLMLERVFAQSIHQMEFAKLMNVIGPQMVKNAEALKLQKTDLETSADFPQGANILKIDRRYKILWRKPDGTATIFDLGDNDSLAQAFVNTNHKPPNEYLFKYLAPLTRFYSRAQTWAYPVFMMVTQALRDFNYVPTMIGIDHGLGKSVEFIEEYISNGGYFRFLDLALKGAFASPQKMREFAAKGDKTAQMIVDFEDAGGASQFADFYGIMSSLERELTADPRLAKLRSNDFLRIGYKFKDTAVKILDSMGTMAEYGGRIAAFNVLRKTMGDQDAATYVRNLQNFTQSGSEASNFASLIPFFRAAMTGADRLYMAIRKPEGGIDKAKAIALLGWGTAMGFLWMMMLDASLGDDEDDEPVLSKIRPETMLMNLVLPIEASDDSFYKIPLGYGMPQLLPSLGVLGYMVVNGYTTPSDAIYSFIDHVQKNTTPLQPYTIPEQADINDFLKAQLMGVVGFNPVGDTALSLAANRKRFGVGTIYNQYKEEGVPWYSSPKLGTPQMFTDMSKWLYDNLGIDVAPEVFMFGMDSWFGGVGRSITMVMKEEARNEQFIGDIENFVEPRVGGLTADFASLSKAVTNAVTARDLQFADNVEFNALRRQLNTFSFQAKQAELEGTLNRLPERTRRLAELDNKIDSLNRKFNADAKAIRENRLMSEEAKRARMVALTTRYRSERERLMRQAQTMLN